MIRRCLIAALLALLLVPVVLVFILTQPIFSPTKTENLPVVDSLQLTRHVYALSETFYPRSFDQPENLAAAATYIYEKLEDYGAEPYKEIYEADGQQFVNIIAQYGVKGAKAPHIVIGAHYDSYSDWIELNDVQPETHTPGADDNASGVAGLLELARLFSENPPDKLVTLVFFATEEPPFFDTPRMGSAVNAVNHKISGQKIDLMISLEMIGYFSDEPGSQGFPLPGLDFIYPDTGNFITIVGRLEDISATRKVKSSMQGATDLPVYSINALPAIKGLDFSDHKNYWAEGYTALMITDTAFYRNHNYHMAGDKAHSLDYKRMAKVVQGIFAAVQGY